MGKRSSFERRERDFYPTPRAAVLPLLPHLEYGTSFVEPCAGDLALVKALEGEGASCLYALDIAPRHPDVITFDALGDTLDMYCQSADYIITNPPWARDLLHPMIRHFAAIRPSWLLFDADWVHTRQAAEFTPFLRAIVSVGRVRWIPETKYTGKDNCAWHLFDARASGPAIFHGRAA
ncbi:class I SAM-dependent methyltransferase [Pseudogemmobacter faecipullorum]|uniref:Class I SAM-dependent methyltransferase n=1 Tax=Pseudogemmobacter faecipullorum TaxID=2755041 RepID=A0ABS8CQ31_9RHOB|nr:class I SAM-dependent methyltransferase [Pseudogemmobacter faecipullorum]MCB5411498.1 class I SAM-dependent methyltransferase [Pseudogemmobacter faecipullorum]